MANQKNGNEQNVVEQQQVQNNEAPQQAAPTNAAPQQPVATEKSGFGGWLKKHWKGVTAAATGAGMTVASAILAYRKGKQAGACAVPPMPQQNEEYDLNPNE